MTKKARSKIDQGDRNAVVELAARGSYPTKEFCKIAGQFNFSSCTKFKKLVATKKRRLAALELSTEAALVRQIEDHLECTFETPMQRARRMREKWFY